MKKSIIIISLLAGLSAISCKDSTNQMAQKSPQLNVSVVNETDPICGMDTKTHLKDTLTYKGELHGFCSSKCKEKFAENPSEYIK